MFSSAVAFILLVLFYIVYSQVHSYLKQRRFHKFAQANGCLAPHYKRPRLRDGGRARIFYDIVTAERQGKDILDDVIVKRFRSEAHTFMGYAFVGNDMVISTEDPQNIQAILATKFKDFETGELRAKQFGTLLGRSIFTSDGPFWEHSRALFRPQFTRDNINDLEATEKSVELLFKALPCNEDGWTDEVDLMPMFFRFTMDTAVEFLFGATLESQLESIPNHLRDPSDELNIKTRNGSDESMSFAEAMTSAQEALSYRIRMQGLYWLINTPRQHQAIRSVRAFLEPFVQTAISSRSLSKPPITSPALNAEKERYNLLHALANDIDDSTELRDQLLALFVAGRDTTASLLSWLFILLSQHPHTLSTLRAEILTAFPNKDHITFSSLKACRYLQHVLSETLRLFPVVPLNNRRAAVDTVLPVGGGPNGTAPIAIPKGTSVNYSVYSMHRRVDLWGADAEEFRPERWEGRKSDWSFLPFNGGPRICLGQQYALTEAGYLVVRLLQRFDVVEPVDRALHWKNTRKGLGLTMSPRDGVRGRLRRSG